MAQYKCFYYYYSPVLDVDYSPTGKEFVSGSYDKSVRIFPCETSRSRYWISNLLIYFIILELYIHILEVAIIHVTFILYFLIKFFIFISTTYLNNKFPDIFIHNSFNFTLIFLPWSHHCFDCIICIVLFIFY